MSLLYLVLFSLLAGLGAAAVSGGVLLLKANVLNRFLPGMISFSAGTLLGSAFLGMIPHAMEHLEGAAVLRSVLIGLFVFAALEKTLVWRHCHKEACDFHASAAPLVILGDCVHKLVDGLVIGVSFHASTAVGIAAALATTVHEVPRGIGEYAILLQSGMSSKKSLLVSTATGFTTLAGALLGLFLFSQVHRLSPYLLSFAASGFLYVALADLIPSLRRKTMPLVALADFGLMVVGVMVIRAVVCTH